jgi:hypothetical protein
MATPPLSVPLTVACPLRNIGESLCFMNCVLQCLLHTPAVRDALLQRHHSRTCPTKANGGCWSCWLEDHANGLAFTTSDSASVRQCKANLVPTGFTAGQEHDAHEFLIHLRDQLQREAVADPDRIAEWEGRRTGAEQLWNRQAGTAPDDRSCLGFKGYWFVTEWGAKIADGAYRPLILATVNASMNVTHVRIWMHVPWNGFPLQSKASKRKRFWQGSDKEGAASVKLILATYADRRREQ